MNMSSGNGVWMFVAAVMIIVVVLFETTAMAQLCEKKTPVECTTAEYEEIVRQVLLQYLLEGHEASGFASEETKEAVTAAFKAYLYWLYGYPHRPTATMLMNFAQEALDAGSEDPMIEYVLAYGNEQRGRNQRANELFIKLAPRMRDTAHHPFYKALAYRRCVSASEADDDSDEKRIRECADLCIEYTVKSIQSAPRTWFHQRLLTDQVMMTFATRGAKYLRDSLADRLLKLAEDEIDQCTLLTWLAAYHLGAAWDARGSGFADTVTEGGWSSFHEQMPIARQFAERAYRCDPTRPEAPYILLRVTKAGHGHPGDTMRHWLDRANSVLRDHQPSYGSYFQGLRPRWGGTHTGYMQELERVLATDLSLGVRARLCDKAIIDFWNGAGESFRQWTHFNLYKVLGPSLREIVDADDLPRAQFTKYGRYLIILAWLSGAPDEVTDLLAEYPIDRATHVLWDFLPIGKRGVFAELHAPTQETRTAVQTVREHLRNGNPDRALDVLDEIATDDLPEVVRTEFNSLRKGAELTRRFLGGEKIEFEFDPDLLGWTQSVGEWRSFRNRRVTRGSANRYYGAMMSTLIPAGGRWQLSGQIDMRTLRRPEARAGVFFRMQFRGADTDGWCYFEILRNQGRVALGTRDTETLLEAALEGEHRERFDFVLKVWDKSVVLRIDDQLIFAGEFAGWQTTTPHDNIAIGSNPMGRASFAQFYDLDLRKLTEKPQSLSK